MPAVVRPAGPIIRTQVQVVLPLLGNYRIMQRSSMLKRTSTSRIGAVWLAVGSLGRCEAVYLLLSPGANAVLTVYKWLTISLTNVRCVIFVLISGIPDTQVLRSAVHFTNALHDKFSRQPATPIQQMSLLSTEGDSEDSDRRYPCPRLGCYKAYRQASGLRYHLKHVSLFFLVYR